MKKHIYLHFSNFDQLRELREDERFEGSHEYPSQEAVLVFSHEYGRIKTYKNDYHILVGKLEQEGCPWCGSPAKVVKLGNSRTLNFIAYCVQCMGCGARGPSLNIYQEMEENKEMFRECMDLLWQRYKSRRAWDEGFVNPYESYNSSQAVNAKPSF